MKAINYGSFAVFSIGHGFILHDHSIWMFAFALVVLRVAFMVATVRKAVK